MKEQKKIKAGVDGSMGFLDHLEELRTRLLRFTVVLVVCVLATYAYRAEILDLIRKPVDEPLKKYTTTTKRGGTNQEKKQAPLLSSYNCSCQPVLTDEETAQLNDETMPVQEQKETTPQPEQLQKWNLIAKIKSTFNDFLVFYQVMTDRKPTPLEPEPVAKSKNRVNSNPTLPEQMQLTCTCTIKPELSAEQDGGATMVYIGLPELFFAQMKVAIFAGFFLAFPYLLIEIWGFVGPALYQSEKKVYWIFSISSVIFFIGGALFGYFIVFPYGFDFFLSLSEPGKIMPSLSIGEFLGFSLKLLLAFGAIFEMPLIVFILARIGVLTPEVMIKHARVAVLVVFIISAVLTPPDPFTMMLMAGPLIMLYIVSVGVCFVAVNRKKAAQRAQGIEWDDDLD